MDTIANRNNNPGNIKDSSTGQFKTFSTPQEGYAALLNDLEMKKTGKSQTGLTPDSTLADFAKAYAPASDKNNPAQYTANLANHMGVRPDAKISELDTGKWAEAIANAEGYSNPGSNSNSGSNSGSRQTFQQAVGHLPPIQHSGALGTNPNDSIYGKILDNSITRGIMNVGDALSFGGATQLGKQAGTGLAAIPAAAKDIFTGKNESQFHDQPSFGETVKGAAKTVAGVGLLASSSLLGGAGKAVNSEPVAAELAKYAAATNSTVDSLSAAEKVNVLTEAASSAEAGLKPIFTKALQELAPQVLKEAGVGSFSELNPTTAKVLGLSWKALKYLIGGTLIGAGIKKGEALLGLFK